MRLATLIGLTLLMTAGTLLAERPVKAPTNIVWHVQYDSARRAMQADQRPMLLFIKSDHCIYCEKMEAQTYSHPDVIRTIAGRYVPTMINRSAAPELARQLGVRIHPTTVIINQQGRVVDSIAGYVTAQQFQQRLNAANVKR